MSSLAVPSRPAASAALTGGAVITVLGVIAAFAPDAATDWWFAVAGFAALILVVAVLGLRAAVAAAPIARPALATAALALLLFGLAHLYALVDLDTALLYFSIFMAIGALALIVAGVALIRARSFRGAARFVPLLCGLWPIVTIPVGAALGDVPHFLAIAVWGICWIALGIVLRTAGTVADNAGATRTRSAQH